VREDDIRGLAGTFVYFTRNRGALQQLRHLDLGGCEDEAAAPPLTSGAPPFTSGALAALALLPALQSLHAIVDMRLEPTSWAALASLTQLTGLRLYLRSASCEQHLQQIVDAAPQLQELWVYGHSGSLPGNVACLTALRSLGSLELHVPLEDVKALRSLTALQGLTHLRLDLDSEEPSAALLLLAAVAQLTGLMSLSLTHSEVADDISIAHLAILQQLTSLALARNAYLGLDDALALASLGQLRRLQANFDSAAAAAAAGLARLEECRVDVGGAHQGERVSFAGRAWVDLLDDPWRLDGYDLGRVHSLSLNVFVFGEDHVDVQLSRHLQSCRQLRALSLTCRYTVLLRAALLQAVAALPQLQHLHLHHFDLALLMSSARCRTGASWQCWQAAGSSSS
jgi:hypothetical protein